MHVKATLLNVNAAVAYYEEDAASDVESLNPVVFSGLLQLKNHLFLTHFNPLMGTLKPQSNDVWYTGRS